ncbi:MAG: hypothetical protein ACFFCV_04510 [Promethearchaeota archaeon]
MNRKSKIIFFTVALLILFPIIALFFSLVIAENAPDLTKLIPLPNSFFDIFSLFILSPLLMIIFVQFLSGILAYILFKMHNIIKFRRYDYAIFNNVEKNLNKSEYLIRAFLLGFFAFAVGEVLVESISRETIIPYGVEDTSQFLYVIICTLFVLPILSLIAIPVWILLDSGILCSRKRNKIGRQKLPDIEGVYRTFQGFINGYVGIATLLAIFLLITADISEIGSDIGFIPFMFIAPFVSTAICFLPLLFYDWQLKNLREKFIAHLKKIDIKTIDDISKI